MVQLYPYPKIWEQKIVEICYIDGAIATFQLFCDHQGTESKSRKIKFCVAGTIFTHPNIRCPIGKRYAYSTRWWKNILAIVHIYGAWAISLLFCDHQDTESESQEFKMSISQPIYNHKKIPKALWKNDINNIEGRRIILWQLSIIWSFIILYYFVITKTLNLNNEKNCCSWTNINKGENIKGSMVHEHTHSSISLKNK